MRITGIDRKTVRSYQRRREAERSNSPGVATLRYSWASFRCVVLRSSQRAWAELHEPPMATPNCSTYGRSNCSRQGGRIVTIRV